VVAAPSRTENFSLTIAEAMAAARPVVACRVGGLPEMVVDHKSGLLVPPGDADALARAIRFLADHPEERRRIGEAGRAAAEARFSMAERMKRVRAFYDRLMSPPVPHG